jgi:hypothetical protein
MKGPQPPDRSGHEAERPTRPIRRSRYEERQELLDPHRLEERDRVVQDLVARLDARGVTLSGTETSDEVGLLIEAIERFETAVASRGGDLFVDTGDPSQPDDPRFVLPKRRDDESVAEYLGRVDEATLQILKRRR